MNIQKNGVAAVAVAPEKETKTVKLPQEPKVLTAEEISECVIKVGRKIKEKAKLVNEVTRLENFKFESEDSYASFTIMDDNRNKFETSNLQLMRILIERAKEFYNANITQYNKEIETFRVG